MDIEFRTWLINEKKMVYGYEATANSIFTRMFKYRKSEVEVMQYTGLKDKNDVKIYKEDIVKTEDGEIFIIDYYSGCFWLRRINGKGFELWRQCNFSNGVDTGKTWFEVIGNIYENPEL